MVDRLFIVIDAFDITVAPAALAARVEETDAAIMYTGTWSHGDTARAWSGGTAAVATNVGASARVEWAFSGEGVRWIGARGPQMGLANVYLDGTLMTTVD